MGLEIPGLTADVAAASQLNVVLDGCDRDSLLSIVKSLIQQNPHLQRQSQDLLRKDHRPANPGECLVDCKLLGTEWQGLSWDSVMCGRGPSRRRAEAFLALDMPLQAADLYVCLFLKVATWVQKDEAFGADAEKVLSDWEDNLVAALLKLGADVPQEKLVQWQVAMAWVSKHCAFYKPGEAVRRLLAGGRADEVSQESSGSRTRQRLL